MVFEEEMRLPVELVTENLNCKDEHISTPINYVRTLENSLREIYDIVRDVTGKVEIRQKRNYDRKLRDL
jgi:uncharacterized protein YoxC